MSASVIKWHGGKFYTARRIVSLMPPHVHYVEPYFGGGHVLFAKRPEGTSEAVNDLHGELIGFWRVLQDADQFAEFARRVALIPFAEDQWREACEAQDGPPVARAVAFFVRYRQSRQGLGKDFATLSRNRTRGGMNEQVSAWLSAVDQLPAAHERLRRVVILNRDALDVIRQQDGPNTLFYLDPPYLHSTRVTTSDYAHEMTEGDHENLLHTLSAIKGRFLLSGYPSELYSRFEQANNWRHVDFTIDNKASGSRTKRTMTERVWMNY